MIAVGQGLPRHLTVPWSNGTRASVIFFAHAGSCPECARYRDSLAGVAEDLRLWGTRLVPPDQADAARAEVAVGPDDAVVVVADRYGAVYQVSEVGDDHWLPTPREVVKMAEFIDIQCPECGVPSTEWRGASPFPLG